MWYVYILKCADASLYTGITTDVTARVDQHNQGVGAKYTRARLPVALAYQESADDRASASRRELQIKRMPRADKLALIESQAVAPASRSRP